MYKLQGLVTHQLESNIWTATFFRCCPVVSSGDYFLSLWQLFPALLLPTPYWAVLMTQNSLSISYPELEDKKCVYASSAFSFSYWLIDWWLYFGEWPGGNKWTFRKYMTWNPENQIIFSWKIQDMWYLQNQICSFLWGLTKDSKFFQHILQMGLKVGISICGYLQNKLS